MLLISREILQPEIPAAGSISFFLLIHPNLFHSSMPITEPSRHPAFMPFNIIPPTDGIDGFGDIQDGQVFLNYFHDLLIDRLSVLPLPQGPPLLQEFVHFFVVIKGAVV